MRHIPAVPKKKHNFFFFFFGRKWPLSSWFWRKKTIAYYLQPTVYVSRPTDWIESFFFLRDLIWLPAVDRWLISFLPIGSTVARWEECVEMSTQKWRARKEFHSFGRVNVIPRECFFVEFFLLLSLFFCFSLSLSLSLSLSRSVLNLSSPCCCCWQAGEGIEWLAIDESINLFTPVGLRWVSFLSFLFHFSFGFALLPFFFFLTGQQTDERIGWTSVFSSIFNQCVHKKKRKRSQRCHRNPFPNRIPLPNSRQKSKPIPNQTNEMASSAYSWQMLTKIFSLNIFSLIDFRWKVNIRFFF